jgi:hypothetical protein
MEYQITITQKAIIRTLLYFDIFGHALNKSELFSLISVNPGQEDYDISLSDLIRMNLVGNESGHFFLTDGGSSVPARIAKLDRSRRSHRISRLISSLIYLHPFVRGVLVSGSLSKSASSKKDDIDFFIITEPGRLWLCRTLLMLFKKIFLLNSKKYFCLNYFVDTEALEIPEKNIFTATEIAYLIPHRNIETCEKFFSSNKWIFSFFPNLTVDLASCRPCRKYFLKKIFERLFSGKLGDRLDSYFMEIYRQRAIKRFGPEQDEQFEINFKNDKKVAKYHPNGYQHIVLGQYEMKISEFQRTHLVDLSS